MVSTKSYAKIASVEAAIKRYNSKLSSDAEGSSQPWSAQPETTEAEFLKVVQGNGGGETAALSTDELKHIFTTVFTFPQDHPMRLPL
jgi:hypothetical protein